MDLPEAAARKVAAKERRLKEVEVAKLMQVAMIFTHASLAASPAYSLFLSGMAEGARIHGSIGGGKFSELPVRVTGKKIFSVTLFILQFLSTNVE